MTTIRRPVGLAHLSLLNTAQPKLVQGPAARDGLILESRSGSAVPGDGKFDLAAVVAALRTALPASAEAPSDRRVAELAGPGWTRLLKSGVEPVVGASDALRQNAVLQGTGAL